MAQGFVRDLNLIESDTGALDRGILDNLGGPNITNDLLLFDGNFKFVSKLQTDHYTYDASADVTTVTGEGKVAFSDGTQISFGDDPTNFKYTVHSSNGIDKFRIYNSLGQVVAPNGDLRRNDGVSFQNLSNLSSKRLEVSTSSSTGVSDDSGASDLFNQYSAGEQVDYISSQLGIYYYKRGRVPLTFEDSSFTPPITFRGQVMIVDSTATISSTPDSNSPGLFIIDANNPSAGAIRAFSDASNPWSDAVSGVLSTTEISSEPNVLALNPDSAYSGITSSTVPNIVDSSSSLLVTETISTSTATHKLPVLVNGQQYFILLAS
jgi:hypothetical protein